MYTFAYNYVCIDTYIYMYMHLLQQILKSLELVFVIVPCI